MRALIKIVPGVGLAVSALALSALPAGAAAPAIVRSVTSLGASVAAPAVLPNSTLRASKTVPGKVSFSPTTMSATWSSSTVQKCTAAMVTATITNKAKATETLTYKKQTFEVLTNKEVLGLCFDGTGTAVIKLGIEGQTSKLTITVS
jgi:hypothetical protein